MLSIRSLIRSAVLLSAIPASFLGQQIAIGEYADPIHEFSPWAIVTGSDGNLWFTQGYWSTVGRLTTSGSFTIFDMPQGTELQGITAGPDGALWAVDQNPIQNAVWRITTAGQSTSYPVSTGQIGLISITLGPDGALWFTEQLDNQIGRITTAGVVTEFPIPTSNSVPEDITPGPDGALWFTEVSANQIGRITTGGSITEYPLTSTLNFGITAGPDGALWFGVYIGPGCAIARMTTSGVVTQYPMPDPNSVPDGITSGPDGALWFTDPNEFGPSIGRITTSGTITEYPIVASSSLPFVITTGPDGNLWFTDENNTIGTTIPLSANLSVSPATGVYQTPLEFTGSGFKPSENVLIYPFGGSKVLASAVADSSGGLTASVRAAPQPYGPGLFLGSGQTSGKVGAASFSENPRLVIIPDSGSPGSSAVINAAGFPADEFVEFFWDKPNIELGTATAFPTGSIVGKRAVKFTVPAGASPGIHIIYTKKGGIPQPLEAKFTVE